MSQPELWRFKCLNKGVCGLIVLLPYALVWKKKCYRKFVLAGCGGGRRECSVWEDKVFLDANDSPGLFYVIYQ